MNIKHFFFELIFLLNFNIFVLHHCPWKTIVAFFHHQRVFYLPETDFGQKTRTSASGQRDDERARHTAAESQEKGQFQDSAGRCGVVKLTHVCYFNV